MKKLSKEQIIDQLEDGIEQLRKIFSEAVIETEQERIIRKNRIISKLERENYRKHHSCHTNSIIVGFETMEYV